MSKNRYVSPEALEQQTKQKKQNKILFILLFILFIPPLVLFPAYPKNQWQYDIYRYITNEMLVIIGTEGPLPFFTILSSVYTTFILLVFSCYFCFVFYKKIGINDEFQVFFFSKFFQIEFESSKKYPFLEKPIIKEIIVSLIFVGCFFLALYHFVAFENITLHDGSHRGALIQLSYNFKIGVLIWESCLNLLLIFPIFYFLFLIIYLINYFVRGLGSGKIILTQKTEAKPKRRGKRKN